MLLLRWVLAGCSGWGCCPWSPVHIHQRVREQVTKLPYGSLLLEDPVSKRGAQSSAERSGPRVPCLHRLLGIM